MSLAPKEHWDRPAFVVIDLDPDGNPFTLVKEIAFAIHATLCTRNIPSICKTSGSRGLHICIPTQGVYDFDTCRDFALSVCHEIVDAYPKETSIVRPKAQRRGKLYLDCFQNRRSQTIAAPYSVRPLDGAPVSMPLAWEELKQLPSAQTFRMGHVLERLKEVGDLWNQTMRKKADFATS